MACKKCISDPVIELSNSNVSLCSSCFMKYFEKKVMKTISEYELVQKGDYIGVAVSGGKDSISVLHILNKYQQKRKHFTLVAIAVDEGIAGYRSLDALKEYCTKESIKLHTFSFKNEFSFTLDEGLKRTTKKPCSLCGVLRRTVLNKEARELGVNKLATGHNLDDEAQSVLMNYLKGNTERSIRLGPKTSAVKDPRFIQRIKPLYFVTEKEVATYAFLKKFPVKFTECPNTGESFRNSVRDLLNDFEIKYPGTKHAVINSFLELLPSLTEAHKGKHAIECSICGEPSSSEICNTCKMIDEVKKKV